MNLTRDEALEIAMESVVNVPGIMGLERLISLVTDALLAAINKPLAPGVDWNSELFWAVVRGDWAAVNSNGDPQGFVSKPTADSGFWAAGGGE